MQTARPIIGITGNFGAKGCELAQGYYESVLRAGGIPMVLPPYNDAEALCQTLDKVDGILLSGGGDINPLLLGEEPIPGLHSICPQRDEDAVVVRGRRQTAESVVDGQYPAVVLGETRHAADPEIADRRNHYQHPFSVHAHGDCSLSLPKFMRT